MDNKDGLALPARAPTSEQVFTTVHTEFGHCANDGYRLTSRHLPGTEIPAHIEKDPPYYILLSTYISYLILICLGHVRDFIGKRLSPASYKHLIPRDVSRRLFLFICTQKFGATIFSMHGARLLVACECCIGLQLQKYGTLQNGHLHTPASAS